MSQTSELIEVDGSRITERDVQQSMRTNIWAGFFGMIWVAMTINYSLTLFMEAIGASGVMIGLLMTARQMAISVQIPSALLFENLPEHRGSRKKYWASVALVYRASWFILAGLALCWKPGASWLPFAVIVAVGLGELLAQASAPPWFSWMADLIPHKSAGEFWGRRQSITTIGALIGMFLAGFLLDWFEPVRGKTNPMGFALVFAVGGIFGISDILIHLRVKEPRRTPTVREAGIIERLIAPLRNRDFLKLTFGMGAFYAGIAICGPFALIYLKRSFPIAYSQIALLSVAGSLGAVLSSVLVGKYVDRHGPRILCVVLLALAPLTGLTWAFVNRTFIPLHLPWVGEVFLPQVLLVQFVGNFLGGAIFSGISPCQLRLLALLSNSSGRTMAMAVHWCVIGVVASLGSLLGGAIMDWYNAHPVNWVFPTGTGTYFSFYHVAILVMALLLWSVSLPLILSIKTPLDRVCFGEAVSWLVNPFHIIRSLGSLRLPHLVGEEEKAEAGRREKDITK